MRRTLAIPLLAGLLASALVPARASAQDDMLDQIQSSGEIKVGVADYAPWVMRDANGDWIGFEVDVARRLAEDLGVEVTFVGTSWDDIIHDLLEEHYDIVISGLSITPSRALEVEFSNIYSRSGISLVANRSQMGSRDSRSDFDQAGVTIGVVSGTTAVAVAERDFPNAERREFSDMQSMLQALQDGQIVAAIGSSPGPELAVAAAGDVLAKPFDEPLAERGEAFAIRRGNDRFLDYLNAWITYEALDGWLKQRHQYWFDSTDWLGQL